MLDAAKIRKLREERGLSQDEAAKLAGLSGRQKWYRIESGRAENPTLATVTAIAKALGCKAKDLLK